MEIKFYRCRHCGKIIVALNQKEVPTICCGEIMQEIIAGVTDGAVEKHLPVTHLENNIVSVSVGSVEHPMTEEHYIEWIVIKTNCGFQVKYLTPNTKPLANFILSENEELQSVYAYCNLHSLWKN